MGNSKSQNQVRHCLFPIQNAFFFIEVSACTALSETVAADTPDAWIQGSVAESLDRPHIHLLP